MTKLHPFLPEALIDSLKADPVTSRCFPSSDVFTESHEGRRIDFIIDPTVAHVECISPRDQPAGIETINRFEPGDGRNRSHLAARNGDVPLAYECIRMGVNLDVTDNIGMTPLYLACEVIRAMTWELDEAKRCRLVHPKVNDVALQKEGVIRIAKLFVEQHADVNVELDGQTPLTLTAQASCWPIVELLLQHGARVPPSFPSSNSFKTSIQRSRFLLIVRKTRPLSPRPPRPCPCWSGKLLSECHDAEEHAYPASFLCICGSRKSFARCCGTKKFRVVERWNSEAQRIVWRVISEPTVGLPPGIPESVLNHIRSNHEIPSRLNELGYKLVERICSDRNIDPAFAYALRSLLYNPRPWAGQVSRVQAKRRMNAWNQLVDDYIASRRDPRRKLDVEIAAKIGINGGPLYKHCEATGCNKHEKRDVEKLKGCSGCKAIFYCSQACQTMDWKRHKAECRDATHGAQRLPSQVVTDQLVVEFGELANIGLSLDDLSNQLLECSLTGA
ncbi:unnamed protein product [Somion occarium]|uniref:MYND-type domain-containing protein n=1 Tax=Somion occarium TaxID=3059160 RepID=A0ABP1EAZ1_9APHY